VIPLSRRYLPHISIALLLTLIPVAVHSYVKLKDDDCVRPSELFSACDFEGDRESTGRRLKGMFGDVDWCGGTLPGRDGGPALDYWILRSYDPKKVYHLPEIGFVRGAAPSARGTEWLQVGSEKVPVHRSYYPRTDVDVFVAYMLIYDSEPIGNPYIAQLLSFPRQLIRGTAPMNLFFVSGRGPAGTLTVMEQTGIPWLLESLRRYRLLCGK